MIKNILDSLFHTMTCHYVNWGCTVETCRINIQVIVPQEMRHIREFMSNAYQDIITCYDFLNPRYVSLFGRNKIGLICIVFYLLLFTKRNILSIFFFYIYTFLTNIVIDSEAFYIRSLLMSIYQRQQRDSY